jgi:hypothetical protein
MPTKEQIVAKAQSIAEAITAMKEKERAFQPTGQYGDEYNKLRNAAVEFRPDLKDILPPVVALEKQQGGVFTRARYVEILTYADQIGRLLMIPPAQAS